MDDVERIAIADLADDLQVRKQRIFKLLPRLGIRPTQRRDPNRGNQNVATLSQAEVAAVRAELENSPVSAGGGNARPVNLASFAGDDVGFFYLIQLEPEYDSMRFKVGFTTDLDGRLQKHRCSAPFSRYVASWPCRRVWERAAMDCLTNGCEQLHTEVFRSTSLERVTARAQVFFEMMPNLRTALEVDEQAEVEKGATISFSPSAHCSTETEETTRNSSVP